VDGVEQSIGRTISSAELVSWYFDESWIRRAFMMRGIPDLPRLRGWLFGRAGRGGVVLWRFVDSSSRACLFVFQTRGGVRARGGSGLMSCARHKGV